MYPFNCSLSQIWQAWYRFSKGKTKTKEFERFKYYLENNLLLLHQDIVSHQYCHGPYRKFTVCDNKKREVSVAPIRDKIIHRLLYDYLVKIYDKTFIFDVWSCRVTKGVDAATLRALQFLVKNPNTFIWRADITKFFDNVDQKVLWQILNRKITDKVALYLIKEVLGSFNNNEKTSPRGMPIGNLTSQIMANIYLNELDRFVNHVVKPIAYLRYGDDFIIVAKNYTWLKGQKKEVVDFLTKDLKLNINLRNNIVIKAKRGIKFLGVDIFPKGKRLNYRNWKKVNRQLSLENASSYYGLVWQHNNLKRQQYFGWRLNELLF